MAAALFHRYYPMLLGLARLLAESAEAEDLVQTAFVGVLRRGRLKDPELAGAYLKRSVVNLARSRWRHAAAAARHRWIHPLDNLTDGDVAQALVVREAVRRLPRRQREAVVLRYFVDLSEAETAQVMGVAVGSVKGYTSRGRAALLPMLTEELEA